MIPEENVEYRVELLCIHLRRVRETLGLSQPEVARRVGVSKQTVENWELGRPSKRGGRPHIPNLSNLIRWADALGCDVGIIGHST